MARQMLSLEERLAQRRTFAWMAERRVEQFPHAAAENKAAARAHLEAAAAMERGESAVTEMARAGRAEAASLRASHGPPVPAA